jgi:hypothetical protein
VRRSPRKTERLGQGEGLVAVLAQDAAAAGLGASSCMVMHDAALDDPEALGGQGLDADVVGAGGDRGFDARVEQLLEGDEEQVLHRDPERQDAVQEPRDRRQLFPERAVLVDEIEAGSVLQRGQRAAVDFPGVKQLVELPQCRLGVRAFEIVVNASTTCWSRTGRFRTPDGVVVMCGYSATGEGVSYFVYGRAMRYSMW